MITSNALYDFNQCPLLVTNSNIQFSPKKKLMIGASKLLSFKIASRSNRVLIEKYCEENFLTKERQKYINILNLLNDDLVDINRYNPILNTNIETIIDNVLIYPVKHTVDFIYARKSGPCYSKYIFDFIDSSEPLYEEIGTHLFSMLTSLVEYDINKELSRNIELIIPYNGGSELGRYLITITKETEKYIYESVYFINDLIRRYYVSNKYTANWSDKCIWCSQRSGCSIFKKWRVPYRELIQRSK